MIRAFGQDVLRRLTTSSRGWGKRSKNIASHLKRERPLQLLCAFLGGAVVVGLFIGIEKAGKHE
jgi:hypothetical protein